MTVEAWFVLTTLVIAPAVCAGLMLLPKKWLAAIDKKLGLEDK